MAATLTLRLRPKSSPFSILDVHGVWFQVRVLSAPPRSHEQTGISRFSANRPELAAICAHILSLQSADWIAGSVSGSLSLPLKIFPTAKMTQGPGLRQATDRPLLSAGGYAD